MIRFPCHCAFVFELQDDMAGSLIQCPKCGRLNDIPTLSDLQAIADDGTYKIEDPVVHPEPDRLQTLNRAFSRHRIDAEGEEIDLRSTPEQVLEAGSEEVPLELAGEVRPGPPKYDPETGELVRPIDIKPSEHPAGASIPMATPVLSYASVRQGEAVPFGRGLGRLFGPINLLVMLFIFLAHLLLQLTILVSMFFFFAAPMVLVFLGAIIAHYGVTIEEIGPDGRDELPRPLRNVSWRDDLWGPFVNMVSAFLICYLAAFWCLGASQSRSNPMYAEMGPWLALLFAGLGTILMPAVLLTTTTSGTVLNLRPDRVMGVMRACGGGYVLGVLLWVVAGGVYFLGVQAVALNWVAQFSRGFRSVLGMPLIAYPMLFLGIFLMHLFCWYLGLLYRAHHAQFPWVLQHHERVPRGLEARLHPRIMAAQAAAKARAEQRKAGGTR